MMAGFIQEGPQLTNTYRKDQLLQAFLKWRLPKGIQSIIAEDLDQLGEKAAGSLAETARLAQRDLPKHIPFDAWGRPIDQLQVSSAWGDLHKFSAEEGLVSIAYQRQQGTFSRLYQLAKLYLFHPSSAFYSCPLAMTDGAARVMETFAHPQIKDQFYPHLVSRDPNRFWTSGQWMTEKTGGSDVGRTETVAKQVAEGQYELHGTKWFCSATTSQMALGLGRLERAAEGNRGLSLFAMKVFDNNNSFNKVQVLRLKDKMGTKALPTAELELCGIPAVLVGEPGKGVKTVATMLNITRIYNSICAVSQCARIFQLVQDFSRRREAFGHPLEKHPLHTETLANNYFWLSLGTVMVLELAHLLGKDEAGEASEEEKAILRLLTPVVKLYTGKMAVAFTSELLECFGGAGYMEDTGIPLLFRDAQVFPIWEGTTNVLSLDVLRVLRQAENLELFFLEVQKKLKRAIALGEERVLVEQELRKLQNHMAWIKSASEEEVEAGSRSLAWSLGQVFSAATLLEMAEEISDPGLKSWTGLLIERLRYWQLAPLSTPAREQIVSARQLIR